MRICVLCGSPRGSYSVTLHTVLFLQQRFPDCDFHYIQVGQRIRSLERNMAPALAEIEAADMLLFCYPVYTFLAPSQLHRFIELLKDCGLKLSGKLAAQITTSKHFYDVTAHKFVEENCADLGLTYLGGLSADMDDLLSQKGRQEAEDFWRYILWQAQKGGGVPAPARTVDPAPIYQRTLAYRDKQPGPQIVIVTDLTAKDKGLAAMIGDFQAIWPYESRLVNIAGFPFAGGCLGCFNCAISGQCIHKDGFETFLREKIQTADAIVYAFSIRDHSMGSRFKTYYDRQFCNGHRPVTMGMPVGYLIHGDLAAEANLRLALEGAADVGGNFLAGLAADAAAIERLSRTLDYAIEHKLLLPRTFLGVGGMKIFRDLIWLMQGFMQADHRFYREHGLYDFPQKRWFTALKMWLAGSLLANPKTKAKMGNKLNEGMIAPYKKALAAAEKEGL